jgi:hypothetical protein
MMAKRMIQKQKRSGYKVRSLLAALPFVAFKDHGFARCRLLGSDQDRMDLKPDNDATRVHGTKRLRPP